MKNLNKIIYKIRIYDDYIENCILQKSKCTKNCCIIIYFSINFNSYILVFIDNI